MHAPGRGGRPHACAQQGWSTTCMVPLSFDHACRICSGGGTHVAMAATPTRLALVGCGDIFNHHLNAVKQHSAIFCVSCVCDPDAERAAAAAAQCCSGGVDGGSAVPAFSTLADALAAESAGALAFDAVILMIPHHIHEEIALQAFSAGKHTLLEKPLGAWPLRRCDAAILLCCCVCDHLPQLQRC